MNGRHALVFSGLAGSFCRSPPGREEANRLSVQYRARSKRESSLGLRVKGTRDAWKPDKRRGGPADDSVQPSPWLRECALLIADMTNRIGEKIMKSFVLVVIFVGIWAVASAQTTHNIVDYGAVGDGVIDNAPAIKAAIAKAAPGDTVFIPAGNFLIDSSILINKTLTLRGEGDASVLRYRKDLSFGGSSGLIFVGHNTLATRTDNVALTDFKIDGTGSSRSNAVRLYKASKAKIERMLFANITATCISLHGNVTDVAIANNRAVEFYEQFVEFTTGGVSGIYVENNHAVTSRGNPNLATIEPYGVVFEPAWLGVFKNIWIRRNTFAFTLALSEQVNSGGVSLSTGKSQSNPFVYQNINILDNTISGTGTGVRVQTFRWGVPRDNTDPASVVIANNKISKTTSYPIVVTFPWQTWLRDPRDNVVIVDNTLTMTGTRLTMQINGSGKVMMSDNKVIQ